MKLIKQSYPERMPGFRATVVYWRVLTADLKFSVVSGLLTEEQADRIIDFYEKIRMALFEVLDGMGCLGGKWYDLEGFSEERAKEIIGLAQEWPNA